jgi:hypothetical protein
MMDSNQPPPKKRSRISRTRVDQESKAKRSYAAITYLGLFLAGMPIIAYGFSELSLAQKNDGAPVKVSVQELIEGNYESGTWVTLDEHIRVYPSHGGLKTSDTELAWLYYPIFPAAHPYSQYLQQLEKKYGDLRSVPESEKGPPRPEGYLILVKSDEISQIGNIPEHTEVGNSMKGILFRHSEWEQDEKDLIQKRYIQPISNILILEKDKSPSSAFVGYLVVLGGFIVLLSPLWIIWSDKRNLKKAIAQRKRTTPRENSLRQKRQTSEESAVPPKRPAPQRRGPSPRSRKDLGK